MDALDGVQLGSGPGTALLRHLRAGSFFLGGSPARSADETATRCCLARPRLQSVTLLRILAVIVEIERRFGYTFLVSCDVAYRVSNLRRAI